MLYGPPIALQEPTLRSLRAEGGLESGAMGGLGVQADLGCHRIGLAASGQQVRHVVFAVPCDVVALDLS